MLLFILLIFVCHWFRLYLSRSFVGRIRLGRPPLLERLAEYGWKPHRDLLARKGLSRASIYWYMRERQRVTV